MLLILDEGYLLTAALPDLRLGPPVPAQPQLLGRWVAPPAAPGLGRGGVGYLLLAAAPDLGRGVTSLVAAPTSDSGYLLSATPPDLGRVVGPLCRSCAFAVWYSRPLPLTSDVG